MRAIFEDRCANCGGIIPAARNTDEPIQFCPACQERARIVKKNRRDPLVVLDWSVFLELML